MIPNYLSLNVYKRKDSKTCKSLQRCGLSRNIYVMVKGVERVSISPFIERSAVCTGFMTNSSSQHNICSSVWLSAVVSSDVNNVCAGNAIFRGVHNWDKFKTNFKIQFSMKLLILLETQSVRWFLLQCLLSGKDNENGSVFSILELHSWKFSTP